MPYCAYVECGTETPIWANAYETRPEQSKPLGLAPPQTYLTPRYCIAMPATPPCVEGGGATETDASAAGAAEASSDGVATGAIAAAAVATDGFGSAAAAWAACAAARRARAARAISACRARSAASMR